jgi:hypothetical protein
MDTQELLLSITIILGLVCLSFYLGYRTAKSKFILAHLFSRLEREDHIRTKTDTDGEKGLVPISQVVAEALEEDRAIRSQK